MKPRHASAQKHSLLRDETTLIIVRARVAPMLRLMYPVQVHPEERVGHPAGARHIREVDMDDERRQQAQENPEPERIEAAERVQRPDDAVLVRVEEVAMLLEDRLVRVRLCPAGRALWGVQRGGFVRTCGTCGHAPENIDLSQSVQ